MQQVADTQGRLALATRTAMQAIGEVALVASAYVAYAFARDFVYEGRVLPAFDNAWEIVGLERTLGIFKEPVLQDWLLSTSPEIVYLFNWFYVLGYLPVVRCSCIFRTDRPIGNIGLSALPHWPIGLIIYELYPLAPPRMMIALGFVDTFQVLGPSEYHTTSDAMLYNPYAAFPSLHFGLAFVASLAFLRSKRVIWKALALVYLVLMLMAIVVTGNHYFVDALAAIAVVGLAIFVSNLLRYLPRNFGRRRIASGTS